MAEYRCAEGQVPEHTLSEEEVMGLADRVRVATGTRQRR